MEKIQVVIYKKGFIFKHVFVSIDFEAFNGARVSHFYYTDWGLIEALKNYSVAEETIKDTLESIKRIEDKILFKEHSFFIKKDLKI